MSSQMIIVLSIYIYIIALHAKVCNTIFFIPHQKLMVEVQNFTNKMYGHNTSKILLMIYVPIENSFLTMGFERGRMLSTCHILFRDEVVANNNV